MNCVVRNGQVFNAIKQDKIQQILHQYYDNILQIISQVTGNLIIKNDKISRDQQFQQRSQHAIIISMIQSVPLQFNDTDHQTMQFSINSLISSIYQQNIPKTKLYNILEQLQMITVINHKHNISSQLNKWLNLTLSSMPLLSLKQQKLNWKQYVMIVKLSQLHQQIKKMNNSKSKIKKFYKNISQKDKYYGLQLSDNYYNDNNNKFMKIDDDALHAKKMKYQRIQIIERMIIIAALLKQTNSDITIQMLEKIIKRLFQLLNSEVRVKEQNQQKYYEQLEKQQCIMMRKQVIRQFEEIQRLIIKSHGNITRTITPINKLQQNKSIIIDSYDYYTLSSRNRINRQQTIKNMNTKIHQNYIKFLFLDLEFQEQQKRQFQFPCVQFQFVEEVQNYIEKNYQYENCILIMGKYCDRISQQTIQRVGQIFCYENQNQQNIKYIQKQCQQSEEISQKVKIFKDKFELLRNINYTIKAIKLSCQSNQIHNKNQWRKVSLFEEDQSLLKSIIEIMVPFHNIEVFKDQFIELYKNIYVGIRNSEQDRLKKQRIFAFQQSYPQEIYQKLLAVRMYANDFTFKTIINQGLKIFGYPEEMNFLKFPAYELYKQIKFIYENQKAVNHFSQQMKCYRGCFLSEEEVSFFKGNLNPFVQLQNFMSCSIKVPLKGRYQHMMVIHIPEVKSNEQLLNSGFAEITNFKQYSREHEILFNPLNIFKISNVSQSSDGSVTITLQYVNIPVQQQSKDQTQTELQEYLVQQQEIKQMIEQNIQDTELEQADYQLCQQHLMKLQENTKRSEQQRLQFEKWPLVDLKFSTKQQHL